MFLSNNYNNRKISAPGSIFYKHNIQRCLVGYENHNALYLEEIATRKLNSTPTRARLLGVRTAPGTRVPPSKLQWQNFPGGLVF